MRNYILFLTIPFLLGIAPFENPGIQFDESEVDVQSSPKYGTNVFKIVTPSLDMVLTVKNGEVSVTGDVSLKLTSLATLETFFSQKVAGHIDKLDNEVQFTGYLLIHHTEDSSGQRVERRTRYGSVKSLFNDIYSDIKGIL